MRESSPSNGEITQTCYRARVSTASFNCTHETLAVTSWDEMPRRSLVTLTPEADEYLVLCEDTPDEARPIRDLLWTILGSASTKLSCKKLLEQWPSEVPRPVKMTLWRLLSTADKRGELHRDGTGVRADPYRYWLSSLEDRWQTDPAARVFQSVADARREIANHAAGLL